MTNYGAADGSRRRRSLLVAAGCYLLFVVYGSLVPLAYEPRPLELAWRDFLATEYLAIGAGGRADWIANILLYMPLAYLLSAGWAAGAASAGRRLVRVAAVFVGCAVVALAVEFAQLFFPPRTVSLNDIVAEFIGSGLGIAIWLAWGGALERLWTRMELGGPPAIMAAVVLYVLAYLALSLFPYDFLVSADEWSKKLSSGAYGLLVAPGTCDRASLCVFKITLEVVAVAPLGILLSMVLGRTAPRPYLVAAVWGLSLGLVTELAQLAMYSGIAEGVSLLTRAGGVMLGVAAHRNVGVQWLAGLRRYIPGVLGMATPLYLLALMTANGWFSAGWVSEAQVSASWQDLHWLPFYYHYFTTETEALKSLLACCAMYLPVGWGYWLWTVRRPEAKATASAAVPALIAGPLTAVMETGKLFLSEKHPDPTNVLIATLAAPLAYLAAVQVHRWALQEQPSPAIRVDPAAGPSTAATSAPGTARVLASMLLLAATGIAAWNYPLGGLWPALALAAYAAVLWRHPGIGLPAMLALLPLLDFSPWTGWIQVNEFDLLVAVTLAVWLLRPHRIAVPALSAGARWAIALLAFSFVASAVRGLVPLSPLDPNALFSHYSSFDALRQLKGFAWALALLPWLIAELQDTRRMDNRLAAGILIGLCAVVAIAVRERMVFAHLLDFAGEYRVEGPFPELHTGGGDIHAYLVMALPFTVAWIALRPTAIRVALGAMLFVLASYALGVTFTRGGYVGYLGAMAVLGIATVRNRLHARSGKGGPIAIAVLLLAGAAGVMLPIVLGSFMESRLAGTPSEAAMRTGHWSRTIAMMEPGVPTTLFGMGLGSFPRTFLFKNPDLASATFSYEREGNGEFVRLGSGRPLFLGQRVDIVAASSYALSLDMRSSPSSATLGVALCEKSFQQSFRCEQASFATTTGGGQWEHHEVTFNSGEIGSGPWLLRRPVVLSLANGQQASRIDVDNVRLVDEQGRNLIANGDFSQGGARWFFAADDHLPWHIFNLWVQILFEQGWIGVLACGIVVVTALARQGRGAWRGDWFSAALLASLCGFLLIGITESLFDGPRVTTLFFLLSFVALVRPMADARPTDGRRMSPPTNER